MKDTELIKTIQSDWAFTRGFLPDYPLSLLRNGSPGLTERAFFDLMGYDCEIELTDLFIEF